jgi:arsenate reductase
MNSFVSLPVHMLDKHVIQQEIQKIGDTPVPYGILTGGE